MQKIMDCKAQVLSKLDDEDKKLYQELCIEHSIQFGNGFDFFDYAAGLADNLEAWKVYITYLRKLGRFNLTMTKDNAKSKFSVIIKASLMGFEITPAIIDIVFPLVISQNNKNSHEICYKLLKQIIEEENLI